MSSINETFKTLATSISSNYAKLSELVKSLETPSLPRYEQSNTGPDICISDWNVKTEEYDISQFAEQFRKSRLAPPTRKLPRYVKVKKVNQPG